MVVFYCLKSSSLSLILSSGYRRKSQRGAVRRTGGGGGGQWKGRNGMFCQELSDNTVCVQAHYRGGRASFPQSTFWVIFFILHPADVSKPPDKISDSLT
jgi:hypothetical protein